mgnify:CR=1 FL=1
MKQGCSTIGLKLLFKSWGGFGSLAEAQIWEDAAGDFEGAQEKMKECKTSFLQALK